MASSPRHTPPPSAAAPRPKGILKNANERSNSLGATTTVLHTDQPLVDEHGNRLAWDEANLTLHEIERENQAARMKIDEPKTPFVRSASLGSLTDDEGFQLDATSSGSVDALAGASTSASTSEWAAAQLAANTSANAGFPRRGSATALTPADAAAAGGAARHDDADADVVMSPRSTSRSPSFSLPPGSRRSSSASNRDARSGVREEMRSRRQGDQGAGTFDDDEARDDEEDDDDDDPEVKAQREAFAQKRNAHYGNEAEAMKIAKALAVQDDEEEEEEEQGEEEAGGRGGGGHQEEEVASARGATRRAPPVPALPSVLPNGRS